MFESKTFRTNYTGWIINRKIYTREELIGMRIQLPDDKGERYFLTSEDMPVVVEKGDEPAVCFFERIKKKLMDIENAKEAKKVAEVVKKSSTGVIDEGGLLGENPYSKTCNHLFSKKRFIKPAPITEVLSNKPVVGVTLELPEVIRIEYQVVSLNSTIGENSRYAIVNGTNVMADFNSDEIIRYFCGDNVIRTRFFKQGTRKDYDGNDIPGKKNYITEWIYNGESFDLETACELGLISQARKKSLIEGGFLAIVVTKSKNIYPLKTGDTTFNAYLERCIVKEGLAKTKD